MSILFVSVTLFYGLPYPPVSLGRLLYSAGIALLKSAGTINSSKLLSSAERIF